MHLRHWNATEIANRIYEIYVDARFDIVKNKGFWLLDNDEKEIDDVDWFKPERFQIGAKQPSNPNLLAIIHAPNYPGHIRDR